MALKDCKILISGPAGNLGGTLAKSLVQDNELWGIDRFPGAGQEDYWRKQGLRTVAADFATDDLSAILPDDFDYVVHVAANCDPVDSETGMRDNAEGTGLLMSHCRRAKAFLHVSTVGVYAIKDEAEPLYRESDMLSGASMGHYTSSKLAAEGAARAMCRVLDLPTIICRMAVQYGETGIGGMMGIILRMLLEGKPIPLRPGTRKAALISNHDIARYLEPCLKAASVPATIVNWAGDENVSIVEATEHLAALAGVEARFVDCSPEEGFPCYPLDPSRRQAITGPGQVQWRDGLTRLYEVLHPGIRASIGT